MSRCELRFPDEIHDAVREAADSLGVSVNEWIEGLVRAALVPGRKYPGFRREWQGECGKGESGGK